MKHPERVEDYLEHIAEAIDRATGYVQSLQSLDDLKQNVLIQDAVIRNIEIIGEAVAHLDRMAPEFLAQHPQLPWPQMRAMRNAVIHEYFFVDLEIVWTTIKRDLPQLKQQIEALLPEHHQAQAPQQQRAGGAMSEQEKAFNRALAEAEAQEQNQKQTP